MKKERETNLRVDFKVIFLLVGFFLIPLERPFYFFILKRKKECFWQRFFKNIRGKGAF